ncbi:MAG TPA: PEGA domain-containing protein [Polyangiales bacterium]
MTVALSQAASEAPGASVPTVLVLAEPAALSQANARAQALFAHATRVADAPAWLLAERKGVVPSALAVLADIDALLAQARKSGAELDERTALSQLSHAQQLVRGALALPGAAAFYAEVELQLGVTAAQAGLPGLAEASLRRAARVDPRRRLLSGEASPEVVALAAHLWDEAQSSPEGDVTIEANAEGAQVFLDDAPLGRAPALVRAGIGAHVLRVQAPGFVDYGTLLDVEPGKRPAVQLVLAPDPAVQHLRAVQRHVDNANVSALPAAIAELAADQPELSAVLIARASGERMWLMVCTPHGCATPERSLRGRALSAGSVTPLRVGDVAAAQVWLRNVALSPAPAAAQPARPAWQRWYVWSGLAVVGLGAGTLAAVAATPAPEHKLRVVVDPSAVR